MERNENVFRRNSFRNEARYTRFARVLNPIKINARLVVRARQREREREAGFVTLISSLLAPPIRVVETAEGGDVSRDYVSHVSPTFLASPRLGFLAFFFFPFFKRRITRNKNGYSGYSFELLPFSIRTNSLLG